jgi:hypothetical protein
MSTRQQREIRDNYTHTTGRDLGDVKPAPGTRHVIEDRLIEILHDCATAVNLSVRSVNLRPFREFVRDYGPLLGMGRQGVEQVLVSDDHCEFTIHMTICTLKRCEHLQEWSANWLLKHGLPLEALPDGQLYLRA